MTRKTPAKAGGDTIAADARKNLPAEGRALFANPSNDITIPHYTRTLRPTDDLLIRRGQGIELYREVQRDGRAATVLEKRKRALVARDWHVEPASEDAVDRRAAELVERQLKRIGFDRLTLALLDATLMGFALSEIVWERDGFEIQPAKIKKVDQLRITFDRDWQPRLLTREAMLDGIPYPARKAIVHRHDGDGVDPYGVGLGRILFWHVLFKREGVAFWLKALERFAIPVPVGKYPFGTLPADRQRLLDALSGAASGGAIVAPAGTDITWAQAFSSGTLTHESWVRYWDEQSAEVVLGETLTTNIRGGGSRAAAETHRDLRDELIDGDADLISDTLQESLIAWLTEYNVPDAQPPHVRRPRPKSVAMEEEAATARADRRAKDLGTLKAARAQGWAPQEEERVVEEIMGEPMVAVERQEPVLVPPPQLGQAAFAAPEPSPVDAITGQLLDVTAIVRRQWIERVRDAMAKLEQEGGTLRDLPDRLLGLYPELDVADLAAVVRDAIILGELRGRAEVIDEARSS